MFYGERWLFYSTLFLVLEPETGIFRTAQITVAYSDSKTSNDWLAWSIPGKLRPPYARDPDLVWSKHGKLADLKATLAGPPNAAPQPLLPPPRPIDA